MIKYFHELTKEEFEKECVGKMTFGEIAEKYPQPPWCEYPDATYAEMGCWSLTMLFGVTDEGYCKDCEFYKPLDGTR